MVNHNLPSPSTPFIDRTQELAAIAQRLADPTCRLLTLVGPGGIGKTRLALQASADHLAQHNVGVCFVSLVSVDSPTLLASAIATALNLSLHGADEPHTQIANHLHGKRMLLVLDNFEVLLEGVGLLVDLLTHTSQLKILVTSRERLNVQEEWIFPIEGLPYPSECEAGDIERFSAVRLFMQSARRVQPAFILADHHQAVIEICQRVEGLPLALELAASWLRVMMPDQIARQLGHSLDFLTTPLRNVPERHRSLRAVFDYSWELLSEAERTVLRKLSLFRGGFDLEAADYVTGASLPLLAALVDKSLIRLTASGRYDLHELLRQYSSEKLTDAGETASTAQRHLDFFLALAERAESRMYGPEQVSWFDRLELEHGNLHAALAWSLEGNQAETGLRVAAALGWFWQLRMHFREASQWYTRLLAACPDASSSVRAKALHRASEIETQSDNSARGRTLAEESLALAQAANDPWNTAWALAAMGLVSKHTGMQTEPFEEALRLFRELNDLWGMSHTLRRLSLFLEQAGRSQRAVDLAEEALMLARAAQDKSAMAWSLYALGFAHWQNNNLEHAVSTFEESVPLYRDIRDITGLTMALDLLGALKFLQGEEAQAHQHFEENLRVTLELKWKPALPNNNSLAGLVILAWRHGEKAHAMTLLAARETQFNAAYGCTPTFFLSRLLEDIHSQCSDPQFADAWAEGLAMSWEQAAAFTLQTPYTHSHSPDAPQPLVEPLSERELEVLRLLASGLSNAQIANKLYLAIGTIKAHTRNIYGKLGVNSRTQAIVQAQHLNLV